MSTRRSRCDQNNVKESVDDLLANVDQFIQGVYRDLSISPPHRLSMGNTTTANLISSSNETDSSSLPATTQRRENSPILSPAPRRNMDVEIDRINRMCDSVDENLRSIGVFVNGSLPNNIDESISNINLTTTPPSSTSVIFVGNTTETLPFSSHSITRANSSRRRSPAEIIVDLSNTETEPPESFTPSRRLYHDNDDDDVILVSSTIPPIVDLSTPSDSLEISRPRYTRTAENVTRRRSHQDSNGDDEGIIKRRHELPRPSTENNSPSSINETESATTADGRTPFMCPICIGSCVRRRPTTTICGHVFCEKCIEQALTLTKKCPLCNKKISKKQLFRIYL